MPSTIQLKSLTDIGCFEEIIEDSPTIEGNAKIKSNYVKENYGYDCFADDTGLEVNTLNGEPGVYSARYAGEQKNSEDNIDKLLTALDGKENRKAHFKTVISLIINGKETCFEGICEGEITTKRNGTDGFGYDAVFKPNGYNETFANMPLSLKNKIGHRGKATEKLLIFLQNLT